MLGRHEFTAALEAAKKLSQKMPDDVMLHGFLTDANVELGNYKEAEVAAQWMLDLKPGNTPGLTRCYIVGHDLDAFRIRESSRVLRPYET